MNRIKYVRKKKAADCRYRINGRFISEKERGKLLKVLREESIFNSNNNLKIELVSRKLNVIKT